MMPPANDADPASFSSALRDLESPVSEDVLHLAETLGIEQHRDQLQRVMSRLNDTAAYGDRVPNSNRLYDWSPATAADDAELDLVLDELRREEPDTQLDAERERIRSIATRLTAGESLRSTAILQSVRRQPRFSSRTREYLQRHSADREGGSRHIEASARYSSESARQTALQRLAASENRTALDRERREMLSRSLAHPPPVAPVLEQTVRYLARIRDADSLDDSLDYPLDAGFLSKDYLTSARNFITDPAAIPAPPPTSWLAPGAVLSGCQHATSVAAALAGTAPTTTGPGPDPFHYDPSTLAPPTRPWLANSYSTPRSRTSQPPPDFAAPTPPQQDRWPVKVTIHAVDWSAMTLSATMEAYNVPSHPHSHLSLSATPYTRTSSITTYLEGEILDFRHHTLLTESFKSSAGNDATYWRKLPPFAGMRDDELVRALTSARWHAEVLASEWVLMRWKERCFVKALNAAPAPMVATGENASFDDSGCGLTISGFYYTCLRREDGRLTGLYYDPQSSPYQCLELESRRGGAVGRWEFC